MEGEHVRHGGLVDGAGASGLVSTNAKWELCDNDDSAVPPGTKADQPFPLAQDAGKDRMMPVKQAHGNVGTLDPGMTTSIEAITNLTFHGRG